jgi:hypothetical protein
MNFAIVVLSADVLPYSTASIWYANGTVVDVTKLEGGAAYKHAMRSTMAMPVTPTSSNEPSRGLLGLMSLQDYLPAWIAAEPVDSDGEAISWMLKGLKAATEARTEKPLAAVGISCPFLIHHRIQFGNTLRTTVESLGFHYKNTKTTSIAIMELYGIEGQCDLDVFKTPDQKEPDDPPQTYLALDYSRAGISAFLVKEDCGVPEVLREYHNATLAADLEFPGKREDLSRTLEDLIRPIEDRYFGAVSHTNPVEISELVMLGESTDDAMLHDVLSGVFGSKYTDLKAGSDERAVLHPPLFAGSRAVAMSCQKQLEYELTHEWDEDFNGWLLKDIPGEDRR